MIKDQLAWSAWKNTWLTVFLSLNRWGYKLDFIPEDAFYIVFMV